MTTTTSAHTLVVASRNRKKLAEIEELLGRRSIEVVSLAEFDDVPEVVEDGASFAENAAKKATQTARYLHRWTLGEDSGLAVDALQGAPGVYSARYSGPNATDEANNQKLLAELKGVPDERRGSAYICHVAVADPQGKVRFHVESRCRGRIAHEPHGSNGFGYDPLFLIPEYGRTFGELGPTVKRHLSHRARALSRLAAPLTRLLESEAVT